MPRTRPPYPPEFRTQILELARAGRTPDELAKEFGLSMSRVKLDGTGATIKMGRRRRGVGDPEPHRRRAQAPRERPVSRRVSGAHRPSHLD